MTNTQNSVELVPMTDADYANFLAKKIPDYAQSKVEAGAWPPEDALRLSQEAHQRLLPDGLATKDNYLYSILDATSRANVGILWFAVVRNEGAPYLFIFQFEIGEAFRRKGYGTQAFRELENKAVELGLNKLALHVFGNNEPAIQLYKKLGYVVTDINMAKELNTSQG